VEPGAASAVVLDVVATGLRADLSVVDCLARLELAARRSGVAIRVTHADAELCELMDLIGLADVLLRLAPAEAGEAPAVSDDQDQQDQYDRADPTTQHRTADYGPQDIDHPGRTDEMAVAPDHGETTYRGSGRLEGRRALITGGDSGIGRAVAIAFAREGADVVLSYLPEEEDDAQETARWVTKAGRRAVTVPGDIQDESHCGSLVDRTVDELGGIDILVNNAAYQMALDDGLESLTTEQLERTYRTNVFAMYWLSRFALRHMQPGSVIINSTSIQAYQPSPPLLDYAATKAAIVNFTKNLAQAVADRGIRVNAVAPGPVWTPLIPATMPADKVDSFGQQTPLGRAGQPAELAPAYVFFASQESSYVTGETLGVTGGELLA
jgi:NAD(P)-dependent dehydrogenase (short-subunit alcohol dehydrogenase family)